MSSDEFGALMGYINATTDEADEANSEEVRVHSHAHSPSWRDRFGMLLSPPSSSPGAIRGASRRHVDDHDESDAFSDAGGWSDDGSVGEEENLDDDGADGHDVAAHRRNWLDAANDAWRWLDVEDEFGGDADLDCASDDGSRTAPSVSDLGDVDGDRDIWSEDDNNDRGVGEEDDDATDDMATLLDLWAMCK